MNEQETVYVNIGKNKKIQPIDPLICIVKLAMLSVKPEGTKISIHNNRISIQEPTLYQGALRWTLGDGKNDIHSLYYPIRRACELFYKDEKEKEEDRKEGRESELDHREVSGYQDHYGTNLQVELLGIFKKCTIGINKLMVTYDEHPIITRCLSYYNTILTGQKMLEKMDQEEQIYSNNTYLFKNLWTRNEIHIVFLLLEAMSNGKKEDVPYLLASLENFLVPLEDRFYRSLSKFDKPTSG